MLRRWDVQQIIANLPSISGDSFLACVWSSFPSPLVITRDRAPSSYFLAPVSITTSPGAFFTHRSIPLGRTGLFLPSANSPLSYGDTYQRDSVENCLLALPAFNILIPSPCQETLREILSDVKHSVAKYSRVTTLTRDNTRRHLDIRCE